MFHGSFKINFIQGSYNFGSEKKMLELNMTKNNSEINLFMGFIFSNLFDYILSGLPEEGSKTGEGSNKVLFSDAGVS